MSTAAGQSEANRNTAVLLTPPGSGAIAVIRLCGPANAAFAAKHLSRLPKVGRCVHADLRVGEEIVDDIVVVQTEDGSLDLNAHGGSYVTQAILKVTERFGYLIGNWQESAERSLDTSDSIERQMLIDLPRAKSEAIICLLAAQPSAWQAMLTANHRSAMQRAVEDLTLERALAVPTVAIVGPPNVGKSTLANALFGQDRSITADRPGTTRDWVGELANLDGLVVRLVDTPGVRETDDAIEAQAIRQAGGVIQSADCVVIVLDGSRPLDAAERAVLERFRNQNTITVRSKADQPLLCDGGHADLNLCAISGQGIPDLRLLIHQRLGISELGRHSARCWTETQRYKLRSILNVALG